jgi:hypothetical protein
VGVFSHGEVSKGGFGIPDRVVGAEVDFEFVDKDFKVPHPMCGVGWVHEPKLYTPPPFLVDSWSIPSIPVHSQESLESPGSFLPHSQFIPGPFPEQGGVGMGGGKKGGGGRVYEAEEGRRGRDGV